MNSKYVRLVKCYESVKSKIPFTPKIALVLGSGLGDYADTIDVVSRISYSEIEGFPVSTVPGHKGQFVFGYVNRKNHFEGTVNEDSNSTVDSIIRVPVVIMQGRVHYYEGYSMEDVVLPIRFMKMMGASVLFLTNAAGGVNFDFKAGDFMMITDQIANFVPSPLIGSNIDELGLRFCDMSEVYDKDLRQILRDSAQNIGIDLKEGTYIQLTGPNFETPAEVRMCRTLGADAVGMSTACEAIAANHMGMKICGISCISNLGCGMTDEPLSHIEVQETADRVAPIFKKLVTASIINIAKAL